MSTVFSRSREALQDRRFAYTTISNIRNQVGISSGSLSNSSASRLISIASKYINKITNQWFEPLNVVAGFDGYGTDKLNLYGYAPLINIKSAEVLSERSKGYPSHPFRTSQANQTGYNVGINEKYLSIGFQGRCLALSSGVWPVGTSNILLNGWFGCVENSRHVESRITTSITSGTTSATIASIKPGTSSTFGTESYDTVVPSLGFDNAFRARDVVVFLDSDNREISRTIVNSVNYQSGTISFDAMEEPIVAISSGTTIVTYGAVPELIELACNTIVNDNYDATSREGRGIKMEKVDNYQYLKFTTQEGAAPILEEVSSSAFVNNILMHYMADGFVSL